MKYIITLAMLFGIAYGQCNPPTALTISELSTTTARITYTSAANATLYSWNVYTTYPTHAFANSGTTTASTFIFSGLLPSKTYRFTIVSVCSGLGQTSSPDSVVFTTPPAGIIYTPMTAAGYETKYFKADSGLASPVRDTSVGRGVNRPGLLVWKTASGLYVYNGTYWQKQGDKYFRFDNNFTVTRVADTFNVFLNSALAGPDHLIETGGIIVSNVNRVTVLDTIRYSQYGITKIADSAGFTVPFENDGIFVSYALVIDFDGNVDTVRGVPDSFALVPPDLRAGDILIGYIDVFGSSIQVNQASANQRYSVRYIDPVSGLEVGDSTSFRWDPAAKTLSIGANNGSSQSATLLMNGGRFVMLSNFGGVQLNVGSGTGASGVMDVSKTIIFTNRGTPLANFSAENDSIGYLRLRKGIGLKIDGLVNNSAEDSAVTVDFTTKKFKMKKFAGSGGSGWGLTGNAGTDTTTNFTGTTDNAPFQIRANNSKVANFQPNFGVTLGELNTAGSGGIATGFNSRATTTGAFAAGIRDTSENFGSFTAGVNSKSSGDYAVAMGQNAKASGIGAVALNGFTRATGDYSLATGTSTLASGENAFASGASSVASGYNSFAQGDNTSASGSASASLNSATFAIGQNSLAANSNTIAFAENSVALNSETRANGQNSFSAGVNTRTESNGSATFGDNIITKSYGQFSVGYYNDTTDAASATTPDAGNTLFSVGNGTSDADRRNAFTVKGNGNVGIGTASPTAKIQIDEVGINSALKIHNTTDGYDGILLQSNGYFNLTNNTNTVEINPDAGKIVLSGVKLGIDNISPTAALDVTGDIRATGVFKLPEYTVATLPTGNEGDYARVTDALAPTYGATVVGGGAIGTPVFFTAGAWTVH